MNLHQFVPDFDDDSIPTSSALEEHIRKHLNQDGLMEMLWSEEQSIPSLKRLGRMPNSELPNADSILLSTIAEASQLHQQQQQQQQPLQLFMQEDEMAAFLLPTEARFGGTDLLYPAPAPAPSPANYVAGSSMTQIEEGRPPIPPARRSELESRSNFGFLSSLMRRRGEAAERESAVAVEANQVGLEKMLEPSGGDVRSVNTREPVDLTAVTSSSGVSGNPTAKKDLKRKARLEEEDEDVKFESVDTNKRARGSSSARRSRAAEVHNLSERKRRDRINEKMKALQELIPRCNKSDKASMLDEAIEYLKQLQRQVQIMSTGFGMAPWAFPGGQPYMHPSGMRMGMPMDIGPNRPLVPFSQVAGSSMPMPMPTPVAATHLDPRLPAYHPPTDASLDVSRMRQDQSDPLLHRYGVQGVNAMPLPYADFYQQYLSHFSMQAPPCPLPQTDTKVESSTSNVENRENQKLD